MLRWSTYPLGLNVSPRSTALLGVQRTISFLAYPHPIPSLYCGTMRVRDRTEAGEGNFVLQSMRQGLPHHLGDLD